MIYKLYKYGYQHTAYWLNIEVSGLIKNINKNNNINFEPNEPFVQLAWRRFFVMLAWGTSLPHEYKRYFGGR